MRHLVVMQGVGAGGALGAHEASIRGVHDAPPEILPLVVQRHLLCLDVMRYSYIHVYMRYSHMHICI